MLLPQSPDLVHNVTSPTSFRAEYRRSGGSSILSRNVKFQVDIAQAQSKTAGAGAADVKMHCVTFTLISGTSVF